MPKLNDGLKVKTVGETTVSLKTVREAPPINTAEKLRAAFEEGISVLRQGPSTAPIKSSKINFIPNLGENPIALLSYHPIIQTLLKLQWEGHRKRFQAISFTFKAALEEKLLNTQSILRQKEDLRKSNDALLSLFQSDATKLAVQNFEDKWASELEAAREKFQAPASTSIEELLSRALEFCSRIQVEPAQVDVGDLLGYSNSELKQRSTILWKTWELHKLRHANVFKGNLSMLAQIDAELRQLDEQAHLPDKSYGDVDGNSEGDAHSGDANALNGPTSETEQAYKAWMEFVKLLSILKIDYDVRISISKKACAWMSTRIKESMHAELAHACMQVLEAEQASILKNREKVRAVLNEVKDSQGTISAELARACNNKTSQYASALTQMQLTCDLALEATRETLYQHALRAMEPTLGESV